MEEAASLARGALGEDGTIFLDKAPWANTRPLLSRGAGQVKREFCPMPPLGS